MSEVIDTLISVLVKDQSDEQFLDQLKNLFCEAKTILALPSQSTLMNLPGNAVSSVYSMLPSVHDIPLVNRVSVITSAFPKQFDSSQESAPTLLPTIDTFVFQELQNCYHKDHENKLETGMSEPPLAILLMRFGCISSFKYLLDKKAIPLTMSLDYEDSDHIKWDKINLLHYAVLHGYKNFAEAILTNLNKQDKADLMAFKATAKHGNYAVLQPPANLAHLAAIGGKYKDLFDLLQKHGVDFNAPDGRGNTPLHIATLAGNKNALRYLLDPAFKIAIKENGTNNPVRNEKGEDPLRIAILKNDADVTKFFVEKNLVSPHRHPYDESEHYHLALACDYKHHLSDNPKKPSVKIAPLLAPVMGNHNPAILAHRQEFFNKAYAQALTQTEFKLQQYPKRKGWERLIWTHSSRKECKEQLKTALDQIHNKFSPEVVLSLTGKSELAPQPNPEAAFGAMFDVINGAFQRLKDAKHFGWRGPNGSQMHNLLHNTLKNMTAYQKIGEFTSQGEQLHLHVNALVNLHLKEYRREINSRCFNPRSSRVAIVDALERAMSTTPSATPEEASAYIEKINTELDLCLEKITPRCCGWLRGIQRSSMYKHLNTLKTQLQTLNNVVDPKQEVNWSQVENVAKTVSAIELMNNVERLEDEKRQKKSKKVTPMQRLN